MKNYINLIIAGLNILAMIFLLKKNRTLRKRLEEQTDKHWEGNRQIALYSDELRRHKAVRKLECERRHGRCLGCPFDGLVCNERH